MALNRAQRTRQETTIIRGEKQLIITGVYDYLFKSAGMNAC
ncbi:hypothetical protein [Paenibacillus solani]|nr:hypothetical protein [Paenibacillus solani]